MEASKNLRKTAVLCRYAVCLALMTVCAQIAIPLPFSPVPVTLATLMIFVIGGVMGPMHGALCIAVYTIMGLIGVPVFAGFNSFSALTGPTGGFIIGYIPMAAITGFFVQKTKNKGLNIIGMIIGLTVCYLCGALWYMHIVNVGFTASILATVIPFIFADACKIAVAQTIIIRLGKIIK